ncbi:MAG: hypothetical protein A6F71_10840 [Cycloclasticus sp. symbiont of Poecilosclerida sp. M]|nr:MAG: hypothetical protein A6F71_10840 [Cycloclasticus sp. symbiont of Poecilosclerida sp. M]SMN10869.1 hypothetical protein SPBRAN_1044 [uncultured Candidatus Thioglobus sp.]
MVFFYGNNGFIGAKLTVICFCDGGWWLCGKYNFFVKKWGRLNGVCLMGVGVGGLVVSKGSKAFFLFAWCW